MEVPPVRLSSRQGGRLAGSGEDPSQSLNAIDTVLFRQCVSSLWVQTVFVRKLPPDVAERPIAITITINGSSYTTPTTTAEREDKVKDPVTGKTLSTAIGRHPLFQVRFDDLVLLFPGARRIPSRTPKTASPMYIANPRHFPDGIKITLHSTDSEETVFGSTVCVGSGEPSYMSYPRGEATVCFRVFPCVDGNTIMEPLYDRNMYVKTYLGGDQKSLVQAMMDKRREELRMKDKQEQVSIISLEIAEIGDSREDSEVREERRKAEKARASHPEGTTTRAGGGEAEDGHAQRVAAHKGSLLARALPLDLGCSTSPGAVASTGTVPHVHHTGNETENGAEGEAEDEEEEAGVACASHVAVGGSYVMLSTSATPGALGSNSQGQETQRRSVVSSLAPLKKQAEEEGTSAKSLCSPASPAFESGNGKQQGGEGGAGAVSDSDDDDPKEEGEGETQQYTEALTAKVLLLREQTEPHPPDPLTAAMRSLVPCDTEKKLAKAFGMYDVEQKGVLTREQLVHFCRSHQGFADWCADDNTLLLSLAPYIPPHLFALKRREAKGEVEDPAATMEEEKEKEHSETVSNEGAPAPTTGGEGVVATSSPEPSVSRLNVDYLYYHPDDPEAPLQINRQLFDVIAYRLARS